MLMVEAKLNSQWRKLRLRNNFILPKLIGHRGVKNLKPENTLESINTAFDLGLECVEIDVKVSQDNIPLLLHDDTLDRTTTGSGLVCDFTFDQINQLDAGYFFYKSKTDIKVPSLRNVLDLIKRKQKYLSVDLGEQDVRVNAISAGPMRTLAGAAISNARDVFNYTSENSSLKRNVSLDELGNSALYLVSDLSSAITGEIHYVDCGFNIVGMPKS